MRTRGGWDRFRQVAAARPASPAFVGHDGETSFAELMAMAQAWAGQPGARPVAPGDRVLVWSGNSVAMAAAILGVWARGAVPVLLGELAAPRHVAHAARVTGACAVAAELDLADRAAELTGLPLVAMTGHGRSDPLPRHGLDTSDAASIVFTSGSTGLPKGAVQTHGTLRSANDIVVRQLGLTRDDTILCGVPWSFDYGWGQLLATFLSGIPQALPASLNPLAICEALDRLRPTVLAAVPPLLAGLTQGVSGIGRADLSSVRLITSTGSRLAPVLLEDAAGHFRDAAFSLNYGLTETYRTTSLDPALARRRPHSVGTAIHGVSIVLTDEDGRPVAQGEVGEVVHRGAGVFAGYWDDPAATARIRRPDPFFTGPGPAPAAVFTGDLGYLDETGLLHLMGRRDRQMKSMGVRVSPEEIESILMDSGLVREAAVVSRPHEVIGDLLVAVVVARNGVADPLAALKRHARREMSPHMQPRDYVLAWALPRTVSGKVDHAALARLEDQGPPASRLAS